jgi:hypothetical protein
VPVPTRGAWALVQIAAHAMKRFLWISARLPWPLYSGEALYSAGILKALVHTKRAEICVVGTRRNDATPKEQLGPGITWVNAPRAGVSSTAVLRALFSSIPKDARSLATVQFRRALQAQLRQEWEWIVVDHANSAGLLDQVKKHRKRALICYLAHNAEGKIRPEIAGRIASPIRRSIMRLDAEKYRAAMFLADNMHSLGTTIVENLDDLQRLNMCQETLYDLIFERFGMVAGVSRLQQAFFGDIDGESGVWEAR